MTTLPRPVVTVATQLIEPGVIPPGPVTAAGTGSLAAAFRAVVAAHPDAPAVLATDAELSYRELHQRAERIAAAITDALARTAPAAGGSVADESAAGAVGLVCRHGASTVSAMLGAVLAGVTYVPLDPSYPADRLRHQVVDAAVRYVLTDADQAPLAADIGDGAPILNLDELAADIPDAAPATVGPSPAATYLLYTSGSTGVPKGVRQRDSAVLFAARGHIGRYGITPADRVSVLSSFGFDMSVTDTYSALLAGAAVVPIDLRGLGLNRTTELLAAHRVTIFHSTPSVFRYLTAGLGRHALPDLRVVLLGGEEVTGRDVRICRDRIGPDCTFVNGYGTTECSFIAQHPVPPGVEAPDGVVPVGRPLDGIEVLLLGEDGRPHPDRGEICVRSEHVAVGYHGDVGTAAGRFGVLDGVPTYRTGDLATRLPDGTLTFTGRADRQVKIRGNRVELGDVESRLADLPGVAQAAVVGRRGVDDGLELIGYVVPTTAPSGTSDQTSDSAGGQPADLRVALGRVLPDHMVPRAIVRVDEIPLSPTGKLDPQALPDPGGTGHTDRTSGGRAAVDDPFEATIARAWCDVLELDVVDPDATFFDIGGHSLLMALLQQRLEQLLGSRIALATLFTHPTVRGMADRLRPDREPPGPAGEGASATAAQAAQDRAARRRAARRGRE